MHLAAALFLASALVISASPSPALIPASAPAQLRPRGTIDQVFLMKCGPQGYKPDFTSCDGSNGQGGLFVHCRPDDTVQLFSCAGTCQCTKPHCDNPTCPDKQLYTPQPDVPTWLYEQNCRNLPDPDPKHDADNNPDIDTYCNLGGKYMTECNHKSLKMKVVACDGGCEVDCPVDKSCTATCKNPKTPS